MGRHEQQAGKPEPEDTSDKKIQLGYTDLAEGIGAIGLAGVVVTEIVDFGPANLAFFAAGAMLAYDIARRHDTGRRPPPP